MPALTVKRQAWVVVYARRSAPNTLRELYWDEEPAMERARELVPECAEIFVGLMAEMQLSDSVKDCGTVASDD